MDRPLVTLLTGAGISTDSGIPDFRGPRGLWTLDPEAEKLATIGSYMSDPEVRRRAWRKRRETYAADPQPNAAHRAITELDASGTVALRVITQNTDGLHQRAGLPARKVLELHGTSRAIMCTGCGARSTPEEAFARVEAGEPDPPCRDCGAILKTATVMFGENLDPSVLHEAAAVARASTVFFAVGTSLQVYPAAGLVDLAVDGGARLVIVNAEPTPYDGAAAEVVREPIGDALPRLLRELAGAGR
jgi:NAD-dependent deacetylase